MRVLLIALLAAISYAQTVNVVWQLTRTWTGEQWRHTKPKVDQFYAQESDEFHLVCSYARSCEENGFGTTAVQVHNQRGEKVGNGYYCCEQRDIDLWDLKAEILDINIVRSIDIPIKKTPFKRPLSNALSSGSTDPNVWGYETLQYVLDECTEPIHDGIPDLRGTYEDASGVLIVIEQCGDRFLANGHGVYHDFPHVDGKLEHACRDILPDCICNTDIEDEDRCHIIVTAEVEEDCIVLKLNGIHPMVRWCNDINGGITREAVPAQIVGHFTPTSPKNPDYTCDHFYEGKTDWSWLDSDGCLAYSNKCPSCDCSCHGEEAWVTNEKTCKINRVNNDVTVECCSPAESIYKLFPGAWCGEGYSPLTTRPPDCKKAAKSLGYWGDLVAHVKSGYRSSRRPQGCFRSDLDGRFHFNRGSGGHYIGNDMVLCVKDTIAMYNVEEALSWEQGSCRGSAVWAPGSTRFDEGQQWDCVHNILGEQTLSQCEQECRQTENCASFASSVRPDAGNLATGTCCLFQAGASGNGYYARWCYKPKTEITQQQMTKWLLERLSTPSANGIVKGLALIGFLSVISLILGMRRKYEKTVVSPEEEI